MAELKTKRMAELKTKKTQASVDAFIESIPDESRRDDCRAVLQLMKKATRVEPKLWGTNVVGFGDVHMTYESGRELDWFLVGFAPRKDTITLYLMSGFPRHEALMRKLGRFKTGKGCLYLKRLADVDETVLRQLIEASVKAMKVRNA